MEWPTDQDYNEAIQNLATACGDERLRQAEAELNAFGLPQPYSGNFADVYAVRGADGRTWAVKCFKRRTEGLSERYRTIDRHLRQVQLPFTVPFKFVEQGLRIRGAWYPVVRMEWVEGQRLNDFVSSSLDRPQALDQLAELWPKVSQRLQAANLAHADLQHGNVLLVPRGEDGALSLKLIDYDGMYVPALAGQRSPELGHASFQHPQRARERIFSAEVDRFSHLVIFTALRCLRVAGPSLWQRYDNGDNLLFRERDFLFPAQSQLLHELWGLSSPSARAIAGRLVLATQQPLAEVPWLHEIVQGRGVAPLSPAEVSQVNELLGSSSTARAQPGVAATQAVPATGTTPARSRPAGSRSAEAGPATGETRGPQPTSTADEFVAAELEDGAGDEARRRRGYFAPLWAWYGANALLLNVGLVGLLTVGGLVGALIYEARGRRADEGERLVASAPLDQTANVPVVAPPGDEAAEPAPKPDDAESVAAAEEAAPEEAAPAVEPWIDFQEVQSLSGHAGEVYALGFSPRDGTLASAGEEGTLKIWDLSSGLPQTTLDLSRDDYSGKGIRWLAYSADGPDGLALVAANLSREVTYWSATTGVLAQRWSIETSIESLAIRPDGQEVAVGMFRGISLRDGTNGSERARLADGSSRSSISLAYAPDGQTLAAAQDDAVVLWDVTARQVRLTLIPPTAPTAYVQRVAVSHDGQLVASGDQLGRIVLWDLQSGAIRHELAPGDGAGEVSSLVFSPDDKTLAMACRWLGVTLWDVGSGALRQSLEGLEGFDSPTLAVSFSADGKTLATAGWDKKIRLWARGAAAPLTAEVEPVVPPVVESPPAAAFADESAGVEKVDEPPDPASAEEPPAEPPADDETLQPFAVSAATAAPAVLLFFHSDNEMLASIEPDRTICQWSVARARLEGSLPGDPAWGRILAFCPDGHTLATTSDFAPLELRDVHGNPPVRQLDELSEQAACVAFSPEGRFLGACGQRGAVYVWDALTGGLLREFSDVPSSSTCLAFGLSGSLLVSGHDEGELTFLYPQNNQPVATVRSHTQRVTSLVFSPTGQLLASTSADGTIKLWNPVAQEELRTLAGHAAPVLLTAFQPQGRLLASGGADGSLRLWDAETGQLFCQLASRAQAITAIAFSLDGKFLATASEERTIQLWRVPRKPRAD